MKTLYHSEILNKTFDTEKECVEAEKAYEEKHKAEIQLKEERAQDAKKVEDAFKKANEAYKEANNLLNEFVKKHGSFHRTYTNVTPTTKTLLDFFFDL